MKYTGGRSFLWTFWFQGINVRRIVSDFEENLPKTLPPAEFVEKTALGKLENVLEKLAASNVSKLVIYVYMTSFKRYCSLQVSPIEFSSFRWYLSDLSVLTGHRVRRGHLLGYSDMVWEWNHWQASQCGRCCGNTQEVTTGTYSIGLDKLFDSLLMNCNIIILSEHLNDLS